MRYVKSLKPAWQSSKFCLQHILVPGYFASLPTLRNHGKLEFFVHFKPCSFSLPVQQTEKNFDWGSWKCVGRLEFLWFSDPSPFVGWGRTGEDGRMDSLSHLKSLCLIWGMPCPSNSSCELQSFKSQVAFLWHFYFFFWSCWTVFPSKSSASALHPLGPGNRLLGLLILVLHQGVQRCPARRHAPRQKCEWLICCSGIKLWGKIWTCM